MDGRLMDETVNTAAPTDSLHVTGVSDVVLTFN